MQPNHPTQATPLQRTLHGAMLADSVGADFKKGTWTFKVSPHQQVAAGQYILLPAIVAQLALDQEAAEHDSQAVTLAPMGKCHADLINLSKGGLALKIKGEGGYEANLYNEHLPSEQTASYWHPAHWRGHFKRRDTHGKAWSSMATFVQDDFGMLVEVPA